MKSRSGSVVIPAQAGIQRLCFPVLSGQWMTCCARPSGHSLARMFAPPSGLRSPAHAGLTIRISDLARFADVTQSRNAAAVFSTVAADAVRQYPRTNPGMARPRPYRHGRNRDAQHRDRPTRRSARLFHLAARVHRQRQHQQPTGAIDQRTHHGSHPVRRRAATTKQWRHRHSRFAGRRRIDATLEPHRYTVDRVNAQSCRPRGLRRNRGRRPGALRAASRRRGAATVLFGAVDFRPT